MELFGFTPVELRPEEFVYDLEHSKIAEYIMYERKGYPYYCYFKRDINGDISEAYPVMIKNMKESIEVFMNKKPYEGGFDLKHYAYFSFDGENTPTEIYIDSKDHLRKYVGSELDLVYDFFKVKDAKKYLSKEEQEKHLDWLKSLNVDMIGLSRRNGELYKFSTIKRNPKVTKVFTKAGLNFIL